MEPQVNKFEANLPPVVKAAAKRAQELQDQILNPPAEIPPAEGTVSADPISTEVPIAESPPAEAPPVEATPTEGTEYWEHKYKTMKGRYDAEIPRLKNQLNDMSSQINNLNGLLANVNRAAPPPQQSFTPQQIEISAEEIEEYGEDFTDFASRIAAREAQKVASSFAQKLEQLEGQVNGVNGTIIQDARERLFNTMDTEIPNWREINNAPEFIDWLQLTDQYSGAIRHNLLKAALEQNSFPRVAAFFKGFIAELAATRNPQQGEPGQTGGDAPQKTPLEQFAAPGRAKSTAATPPPVPKAKPFITSAEISAFYRDVAANKWKGREAEKLRIEAEFIEAGREGRVR